MSKSKLIDVLVKNANNRNQGLKTLNEILEKGFVDPFHDVKRSEELKCSGACLDTEVFMDTELSAYDRWNFILDEDSWELYENELNDSYLGITIGLDLKSCKASEREYISMLFKTLFNESGIHSDMIKLVSVGHVKGKMQYMICDLDSLDDLDDDVLLLHASVAAFFGNCRTLFKHIPWYDSVFQDLVNRLYVIFMDLVRTNSDSLELDVNYGIHFKKIETKFSHNPAVITISSMIDELIFYYISVVRAGVHYVQEDM